MKIDFGAILVGPTGQPWEEKMLPSDDEKKPVTLGILCALAADQPPMDPRDQNKIRDLTLGGLVAPMMQGGVLDLKPEELVMVREAVMQFHPATRHFKRQAHDMLDGKPAEGG
ncbi:hypothetical protein [Palleronia pelagia]|uniref:Uncharacterized protein n=1 Tax=Palleronia pelagia TaxID=387096 RepID=A0A1H8HW23_9RHOB|nr:hypothetical protein [Palleronia pelagia]SEN59898.1 hypothetical protein SAMN04488011_10511 [Palleronia pelagia]